MDWQTSLLESGVPQPKLQNVVATFEVGARVDLRAMAMQCPFVRYTPRRFAAAVVRLARPRTTCLLFASGKAVCTGATTEQQASVAALRLVLLLRKSGLGDVEFQNFAVQNMVASVQAPFRVDLERFAERCSGFCSYEPTLFPGLTYRVMWRDSSARRPPCSESAQGAKTESSSRTRRGWKRSRCVSRTGDSQTEIVFLCFDSGKCIVTGGQSRQQLEVGWTHFFRSVLVHYRVGANPFPVTAISARTDPWSTDQLLTEDAGTLVRELRDRVRARCGNPSVSDSDLRSGLLDHDVAALFSGRPWDTPDPSHPASVGNAALWLDEKDPTEFLSESAKQALRIARRLRVHDPSSAGAPS